jgi:DNA-binding NarL/FixJ family response regulator
MPIRILIADDDPTIRLLLRRFIEGHRFWEVCGEAQNGIEALEKARQLAPDLVILDCAMPVMTGLQAASEIAKIFPSLPMLLVSVQQLSPALVLAAREAGLKGAVTKDRGSEVVAGVEALLRNETFFPVDESTLQALRKSAG